MSDTPIDIDEHLRLKAKRIEGVIRTLRDLQIVESCDRASKRMVERLRLCVDALDEAVSEIEAVHTDHDFPANDS